MGAGFANLLGAGDWDFLVAVRGHNHVQCSGVAGLSAHLGVEDGLVGNDEEVVALRMKLEDGGFHLVGFETDELGDGFG